MVVTGQTDPCRNGTDRPRSANISRAQPRAGQLADGLIEHRFVVEPECHGWRLDRFLKKRIPRVSRERVQRVSSRGECWVDGRDGKPSLTVRMGQEVVFRRPAPTEPDAPRALPILYADDDLYALDKPAGIAMHPTAKFHHATVTAVLRELFPTEKLQITHRLDLETSGIILIARTMPAAIALKRAFAKRLVEKRYLALVAGALDGEGVVDQPLGPANGLVRVKMKVVAPNEGGLPAVTRWRARGAHVAIARWSNVEPLTGRQHQIRAHLAWLAIPSSATSSTPTSRSSPTIRITAGTRWLKRLPLPRHARCTPAGFAFPIRAKRRNHRSGQPLAGRIGPFQIDLK